MTRFSTEGSDDGDGDAGVEDTGDGTGGRSVAAVAQGGVYGRRQGVTRAGWRRRGRPPRSGAAKAAWADMTWGCGCAVRVGSERASAAFGRGARGAGRALGEVCREGAGGGIDITVGGRRELTGGRGVAKGMREIAQDCSWDAVGMPVGGALRATSAWARADWRGDAAGSGRGGRGRLLHASFANEWRKARRSGWNRRRCVTGSAV